MKKFFYILGSVAALAAVIIRVATIPYNFMDNRITRNIENQRAQSNIIDISKATPFEWDTMYYLWDETSVWSRDWLTEHTGKDLSKLRTGEGNGSWPLSRHAVVFFKDDKFVRDYQFKSWDFFVDIFDYPGLRYGERIPFMIFDRDDAKFMIDEKGFVYHHVNYESR